MNQHAVSDFFLRDCAEFGVRYRSYNLEDYTLKIERTKGLIGSSQ